MLVESVLHNPSKHHAQPHAEQQAVGLSVAATKAIGVAIWITLGTVLVSLGVTTLAIYVVEGTWPEPLALFIAAVIPALVVPGASFINMRLVFRLREANERLAALSETDPLTDTLNRRRFVEVAERELTLAARHGYATTLVLLDFDHFKKVNDDHGHHVGDQVLVRSIEVMRNVIRQSDVLGRFGGEEFILLLPHTGAGGAQALAQRLLQAVAGNTIEVREGLLRVTVSAGCLTCESSESSLKHMLQRADELLYESKTAGRNRCSAASITMPLVPAAPRAALGA